MTGSGQVRRRAGQEAAQPPRPRKQEQRPANDDITELAPGVVRTELPIDFTGLGHVNMYVLVDDHGVTVVDPGMPLADCYSAISDRLRLCGARVRDVHTVILTHSHPDHFGGAGRLAEESGAVVVAERSFRMPGPRPGPDLVSLDDESVPELSLDDRGAKVPWRGADDRLAPPGAAMFEPGMRGAFPPADPGRRVVDGDSVRAGGRHWVALHTPGHTGDHLCLHDPDSGLLLSGDHVLPSITPHISGMGMREDALDAYLSSLQRVGALPHSTIVLPAHGDPFTGVASRVQEIMEHHASRLELLREIGRSIGAAPVSAFSRELFGPKHWGLMAESETFAHLEHLRRTGDAVIEHHGGEARYLVVPREAGSSRTSGSSTASQSPM